MRKTTLTVSISSQFLDTDTMTDTRTLTCEFVLGLYTAIYSPRLVKLAADANSAVLDQVYKKLPEGSRINYEVKIGMVQQMILRLAPDNVVSEYMTRAAELAVYSQMLAV